MWEGRLVGMGHYLIMESKVRWACCPVAAAGQAEQRRTLRTLNTWQDAISGCLCSANEGCIWKGAHWIAVSRSLNKIGVIPGSFATLLIMQYPYGVGARSPTTALDDGVHMSNTLCSM